MPKSRYLANALLNHTLRGQFYAPPSRLFVGLFTVSPEADSEGTEVPATEYIRTLVMMSPPQNKTSSNTNRVLFPTPLTAWGQLVAFGLFDAQIGGNNLYFGPFPAVKTIIPYNEVVFEIGQLVAIES